MVENFGALRACPPPSHSRCASLDTLAPSTPCFGRFRCVKNNTQLFLTCYPVLQEIILLSLYKKTTDLFGGFFGMENFGALRACPPPSHSRCASLDTLAPSTPCFGRFRCVKNNTQLFLTCYPVLQEIITALRQLSKNPDNTRVFGVYLLQKICLWCKFGTSMYAINQPFTNSLFCGIIYLVENIEINTLS